MDVMSVFTNNSEHSTLFRDDGPLASALKQRSELKPMEKVESEEKVEPEPVVEQKTVNVDIQRCCAFGTHGLIYADVDGKDVTVKWYLKRNVMKFDSDASSKELEYVMNKVLGRHEF